MSIYLSNGRGSLVVDLKFRGVGRVVAITGMKDTPRGWETARGMEEMLKNLAAEAGRRDLLRAIKARELDLQDLWPLYRSGQWHRLPQPEELRRAFPVAVTLAERQKGKTLGAIGKWLPTYRTSKGTIAPTHRKRLEQCYRKLERLKPDARIRELPELVRQYREHCEAAGTHREFQLTKAAVQTFLRSALGRRQSLLWAQVADIPTLVPGHGKSARRAGRTFSPTVARQIRDRLGPVHGAQWWDLCRTGMMPDEYFNGKFLDHGDRIEIRGTKVRKADLTQKGRRWREIPRLGPLAGPLTRHDSFAEVLRDLGDIEGGHVIPYDARHTFAYWMVLASIDAARRDVYRGHSAKSMDQLYERPDQVAEFLADDAHRMQTVIGPEPTAAIQLMRDRDGAPAAHDTSHDSGSSEVSEKCS